MKLAIMQPYFIPYIGYFQLLNAVDKFVIYDDVNFIKRGWINRNRILINGNASLLTIPLLKASQNRLINDISINNAADWKLKLTKSFEQSYKKAPFYKDVVILIDEIFTFETENLSEFIVASLSAICRYMKINTEIELSSSIYSNADLSGPSRILDICLQEGADTYINPIGGVELYDKAPFEEKSVELKFIESTPVEYDQFKGEFVPWLSIIDVLMFNSLEQVKLLLNNYRLI